MPVIAMAGYRQRQRASIQRAASAIDAHHFANAGKLIAFAKDGEIGSRVDGDRWAESHKPTDFVQLSGDTTSCGSSRRLPKVWSPRS